MINIALISDTRSGSTALSDYFRSGLKIQDLGEIFFPISSHDNDDDFNYFNKLHLHNGSLKSYYQWILKTHGGGLIAKILYHDFSLGIRHPTPLAFSFPVLQELKQLFTVVIHLKRKFPIDAILSEMVASNTGVFHHPSNSNNQNNKKITININRLKDRISERLDSQLIADKSLANNCHLPIYDIFYEDFFYGDYTLIAKSIFPQFDTSVQFKYKKLQSNYNDIIENYSDILNTFPEINSCNREDPESLSHGVESIKAKLINRELQERDAVISQLRAFVDSRNSDIERRDEVIRALKKGS